MRDRNWYRNSGVTIEETSSDKTCKNPGWLNGVQETFHNLYACFSYFAVNPAAGGDHPLHYQAVTIAYHRISNDAYIPYFQIGRVIELTWAQYFDADLDLQLKRHGIHKLIVIGQKANTCIDSTVRYAAELGYDVTLVKDAIASYQWEEMRATLEVNLPNYVSAIRSASDTIAALNRTQFASP